MSIAMPHPGRIVEPETVAWPRHCDGNSSGRAKSRASSLARVGEADLGKLKNSEFAEIK
jgi:hypothetical protein